MPNIKTGKNVNCPICGAEYYRSKSDIETYNRRQTCGSQECKRASKSGKNNPFWGKTHSTEARRKIRDHLAKNPRKGTGPKKGVFRHTEEAKKRISAAVKRRWQEDRAKMIAALPRGWNNANYKPPELRRYRKNFTPNMRQEWKESKCAYCDSTEDLEIDHIIPVFDGGQNQRENAQTLCRPCNLWKTTYIDVPRYKAAQAAKGAKLNPE